MPASFWTAYIERIAIVAAVLLICYAMARRLRDMKAFGRRGRCLECLDSVMVSQHAALHVVRAGARYFLIGSTGGSVIGLAELTERDVTPAHPSTG